MIVGSALAWLGTSLGSGPFAWFYFGFLAVLAVVFLLLAVRGYRLSLAVRDGRLDWEDAINHASGRLELSTVLRYRIVRHLSSEAPESFRVIFELESGEEVELPPNVSAVAALDQRNFHNCLLRYQPNLPEPEEQLVGWPHEISLRKLWARRTG